MKISTNWLQDFINITIPLEELADKLSKSSTEIKQIFDQREKYNGCVVGEILETKPHPEASKLHVAKVDTGKKKSTIIYGGASLEIGQHVGVLTPGTIVPSTWKTKNEFKVGTREIKGIESEGMLGSARELDLGDDHTGIHVLPNDTEVGKTLSDELELNDVIYDADFLTNQGFCMSHLGLAREISALLNEPMKQIHSDISLPESSDENELNVVIENEKLCPRYTSIIMEGIKTEPSPEWMQKRLQAAGMRPINNIVDVTNYVMLELGQPMHAFDYNKIAKKDGIPTIIVRESREGEKIESLDEKQHELPKGVLLISDLEKPIGVAGIIGGANSEIEEKTTKIVLESANFDAITLRQGARKLSTRTDAVARYEKVLDPNLTMVALKRAVELLLEITEGRVASKVVDVYPKPLHTWNLMLSPAKVNKVLGIEISIEKMTEILQRLGFQVQDQEENLIVTVPTRRRDIKRDVDLIEEIIRIYGYDNVPLEFPLVEQSVPPVNKRIRFKQEIQSKMTGLGFYDIQTYSFTGEELLGKCNIGVNDHIKIINPQSPERTYMQMTLLPEILEVSSNNLKLLNESRLFEIQKVFWKNDKYSHDNKEETYANEPEMISMVWAKEGVDYYDVKGIVEGLIEYLNLPNVEYKPNDGQMITSNTFHPTKSALISANGRIIGIVGEVNPQVIKNLGINTNVVAFELDAESIMNILPAEQMFKDYSRYQVVSQDISVLVEDKVRADDIISVIESSPASQLIKSVEVIDQYSGEGTPDGKKSIAVNVKLQTDDHTLTQEEIDQARTAIIQSLEKKLKAKLR